MKHRDNIHVLVLNDEVEAALRADKELAIVYMIRYGEYDDEIIPLHNPDYVSGFKKEEIVQIENCKKDIKMWHDRYPEFFNGTKP